MGYDSSDHEFPRDDDSEEPKRSNGHDSENPPEEEEAPEDDSSDRGSDDGIPPMPGIGLPKDHDPQFIPTFSELRRVADDRLDWGTAFIILNHDDPDEIVERLDEMADLIRAAISAHGPAGSPERFPNLKKAVRLGLELKLKYWLRANKFDEWIDLIGPLLTTAIQMEEFQPAVFLHWSIYHYFDGKLARARTAIEASHEYAKESKREDLALLAQAYQFNFDAPGMDLQEAECRAKDLIDAARRMGYDFVRGQVYVALTRAYVNPLRDVKKVFEYSQQALVILISIGEFEMANEAITFMLGIIGITGDYSAIYRDTLRSYFTHTIEKSVNPMFQAAAYYFQGRDQYHQGRWDAAVPLLVNACRKYRQTHLPDNVARTLHMLGLVQTRRHKWAAAEFYLCEALRRYREMGDKGDEILALHAHAFIPYEYGDWALALARLEVALAVALENPGATTQAVIEEIRNDIEDVKKKLQGGDPS